MRKAPWDRKSARVSLSGFPFQVQAGSANMVAQRGEKLQSRFMAPMGTSRPTSAQHEKQTKNVQGWCAAPDYVTGFSACVIGGGQKNFKALKVFFLPTNLKMRIVRPKSTKVINTALQDGFAVLGGS